MTPWELVKKSEHSHQRAVFAWANCAAVYGIGVADDPRGYALATRDQVLTWDRAPRRELDRLFAIHNQGHGDKIRGAQARAEGVKAGVPDIMLPVPRLVPDKLTRSLVFTHGLFIELKRPKAKGVQAGKESEAQSDWIGFLTQQGYTCRVCVGWEQAVLAIKDYLQ